MRRLKVLLWFEVFGVLGIIKVIAYFVYLISKSVWDIIISGKDGMIEKKCC